MSRKRRRKGREPLPVRDAGRRYNIYSVSPGMLHALRLLSSHSSVLMLNFQNFYITKGPTTSAEKYPASTKSARQPRPRRGETRALRQLSTATEGGTFPPVSLLFCLFVFFFFEEGDFKALFFVNFGTTAVRSDQGKGNYYFGEQQHHVDHLPRTCPRRRGRLAHPIRVYFFLIFL